MTSAANASLDMINHKQNSEHGSLFCIITLIFLCLSACQAQKQAEVTLISGSTMGTYYRVSIAEFKGHSLDELSEAIEHELDAVNQAMSTYLPNSEVSQFNRLPASEALQLSPQVAAVVRQALEVARLSEGALDITVSPLVRLWGFGPDGTITERPSDAQLIEARKRAGYAYLSLNQDNQLAKQKEGLEIDLSSIAKGFAIDQIAQRLNQFGIDDWLIDVGGELRAQGNKYGQAWQVGIEAPSPSGGLQEVFALNNTAIATSGDYRNFVLLDGRAYPHVINPNTGYPVTHSLTSVSILQESAALADALATALLVMGEEKAIALAEQQNWSVYLISRTETPDQYRIYRRGKFALN